jgi:hypothetical protein
VKSWCLTKLRCLLGRHRAAYVSGTFGTYRCADCPAMWQPMTQRRVRL